MNVTIRWLSDICWPHALLHVGCGLRLYAFHKCNMRASCASAGCHARCQCGANSFATGQVVKG